MSMNEAIKDLKDENEQCYAQCEGHCSEIKNNICTCRDAMILSALEQYQAIGTIEECQEAREKQIAKKIKNRKLLRDFNGTPYTISGDCPNCGSIGLLSANTDYCNACGQKLGWSE